MAPSARVISSDPCTRDKDSVCGTQLSLGVSEGSALGTLCRQRTSRWRHSLTGVAPLKDIRNLARRQAQQREPSAPIHTSLNAKVAPLLLPGFTH